MPWALTWVNMVPIFEVCPTITSNNQQHHQSWNDNSIHAWPYGRFIEIQDNLGRKKLHRTNQGSNFLGDCFRNRDNVRATIQFGRESRPEHLKRWIFLKNRPIHFHINSTSVIIPVKRNKSSFLFIKINTPLNAPVHSVSWIRFKLRSQF